MIQIFTDRYQYIGPAIWILSIQYFIAQLIVGISFIPTYSLRLNTISDLGNTTCGVYSGRNVCSPHHSLMNASLILLGITMATGSLLIYQEFRKDLGTLIGFSFMALAGFGTILVGVFPENTVSMIHIIGASLPFIIGNIALILMSLYLLISRGFRIYTFISGAVALIFLIFFETQVYIGLGIGGVERLVAYPQTAWLIVFGIYISKNRYQQSK